MMLSITLPDGTQKFFDKSITVAGVAASIGKGLAAAALAGKVDEKLVDTSFLIEKNSTLKIITEKDPEGLDVIRHSCAHLLAHAVKILFPDAQVTIGPVIEDGFYYDFAYKRPFTLEELEIIQKKMQELSQADYPIERKTLSREEAVSFFRKMGEEYKARIIEDIPSQEILSLYQQGEFIDLCRGPHVPSTGKIKAFKLTKIAGAYWRGDAKNEMLTRIYGTAWANKKALEEYLKNLAEAEKRDHRKIAKNLNIYHIQDDAPGMIFWHPDGWMLYQTVEQYMREIMREGGYLEVHTPQLVDISLWKKSGHWDKFREDMFSLQTDDRHYAIKPMNCPCHVQIFNQGLKSYRDLPLRLSEFGSCHRNEGSGALHGLLRTRNFTQDDAHIFCTEDQIEAETHKFIDLLFKVYEDFGFSDIAVRLSTRPEKRVGLDVTWDKAEKALENVLNKKKLDWQLLPGEGAFYGPKIEFILKDCIGRMWTTGSIQLDFSMPERLEASYIAEDGSRKTPVMLHRAICGSLERFIAILLEHYAGDLPLWLSAQQVVLMNITDAQKEYTQEMTEKLKKIGIRCKSDLRNEKIGFKIREHTLKRIPLQVIIGEKEKLQQTVAIRTLRGKDLGNMPLSHFIEFIREKIAQRSRAKLED
jgi:threonyl-tRNA synthetase